MSLGLAAGRDSYLVLPSAGPGMVLYFRPTVIVEEKKTMSAGEKKAMMEAQAAKMKAQAAANDPYPGLPSMDGMGRNKKHKDYGKGDPEIQDKVKKIKKAKKAAAAAAAELAQEVLGPMAAKAAAVSAQEPTAECKEDAGAAAGGGADGIGNYSDPNWLDKYMGTASSEQMDAYAAQSAHIHTARGPVR